MNFKKAPAALVATALSTGAVSAQESFFQCSGSNTEANVIVAEPNYSGAFQFAQPAQGNVAESLSLLDESMSPPPLSGIRSTAEVEGQVEYISNLYSYDENANVRNIGVGVSTDFMALVNAAADYCANGTIEQGLYRDAPNPNVS